MRRAETRKHVLWPLSDHKSPAASGRDRTACRNAPHGPQVRCLCCSLRARVRQLCLSLEHLRCSR